MKGQLIAVHFILQHGVALVFVDFHSKCLHGHIQICIFNRKPVFVGLCFL